MKVGIYTIYDMGYMTCARVVFIHLTAVAQENMGIIFKNTFCSNVQLYLKNLDSTALLFCSSNHDLNFHIFCCDLWYYAN